MFDLEDSLKNLPDFPGVYLMKNKEDKVIYVGKAKVLKNRVRQYFQPGTNHIPKIRMMIRHIASFEYIVTDSELDALILENNLIKQYKPKYNTLLKDDKNYPYIKITNEAFPKVVFARQAKSDGAKYFGPFYGNAAVKDTIASIRRIFRVRSCNLKFPQDIGKRRPCLNYHINQCSAPCTGAVPEAEYNQVIRDVTTFLSGDYKTLISQLEAEMREASRALQFEKAAKLRDRLAALQNVMEKQKINDVGRPDTDIIAFARDEKIACFQAFFMRDGKVSGKENYILQNAADEPEEEIYAAFLKQFYANGEFVPKNIVLPRTIADAEVIEEYLSQLKGQRVHLIVPERGENKKLVDMAVNNAHIGLARITHQGTYFDANVMDLKRHLNLPFLPRRIECYDISNTGESGCVGCMSVFVDGKPRKRDFRRFMIRSVKGQNDYAAMSEMLERRFRHAQEEQRAIEAGELDEDKAKFLPLPDLLFVDGGKGHITAAKQVFTDMDVQVPLFGLVKDDKHRTRAIVTSALEEVQVNLNSSLYRFLYQIQEETHAYAIGYHHQRRKKEMFHSELDDIPGVGEKTKQKLYQTFGTVKRMRELSTDQLAREARIPEKTARAIYDHFHS